MTKESSDLVDELDNLDVDPDVTDDDVTEPELSIVDKFISGDLDGVKDDIHSQVVKVVSNIVNKPDQESE
jgi:hypothetical protein